MRQIVNAVLICVAIATGSGTECPTLLEYEKGSSCLQKCYDAAAMTTIQPLPSDWPAAGAVCHHCPDHLFRTKAGDPVWRHIERLRSNDVIGGSWGDVLDAGTGVGSIKFVSSLDTTRWVAVTASLGMGRKCEEAVKSKSRPGVDNIVVGHWDDDTLLAGQTFDHVLVDYLVGSMDAFTPYAQDKIFDRLKRHMKPGARMFVVGFEPFPHKVASESLVSKGAHVLLETARFRDACILLGQGRVYREFPAEWYVRQLEASGLRVEDVAVFPGIYGPKWVQRQLNDCRHYMKSFGCPNVRKSFAQRIDALVQQAAESLPNGECFGFDFAITASLLVSPGANGSETQTRDEL